MLKSTRSLLNPNMSDLISGMWSKNMDGVEYIPSTRVKPEYIEVDEVIKRHDRRVSKALDIWMKMTL